MLLLIVSFDISSFPEFMLTNGQLSNLVEEPLAGKKKTLDSQKTAGGERDVRNVAGEWRVNKNTQNAETDTHFWDFPSEMHLWQGSKRWEEALSELWTWTSNLGCKMDKSLLFFRLRSEFTVLTAAALCSSFTPQNKGPEGRGVPTFRKRSKRRMEWARQKKREKMGRMCVGAEEESRMRRTGTWLMSSWLIHLRAETRASADSACTCSCWPLTPAHVKIHLHCHTIQTGITRTPHPDTSIHKIFYNTHRLLLTIHSKVLLSMSHVWVQLWATWQRFLAGGLLFLFFPWFCLYYCCIKLVCTSKHLEMNGNPNISRQQ